MNFQMSWKSHLEKLVDDDLRECLEVVDFAEVILNEKKILLMIIILIIKRKKVLLVFVSNPV